MEFLQRYATRVSHLRGTAGGLNGSYYLTTSTVNDDLAIDTLQGGTGLDRFFAALTDRVKNKQSGETRITVYQR